jgi:spore coat polysaccharide biosynthesis predicted glycosyltransferase SpsG
VVLVLADNQAAIARELDQAEISLNLGPAAECSPERIAEALRVLLNDRDRLARMSARARSLVDGWGAERVLDAMGLVPVGAGG